MTNNNELASRIFNELFDDEDLDNMKAKGIISQPLGYRLSSIAIIECELDDGCHRMADEIAELRAKITKKDEVISGLIEVLGVSVDETSELRDKHSKMSNEIAELCEALGAVNEIALLIASDIYEDSLLHDNVKPLIDIHK